MKSLCVFLLTIPFLYVNAHKGPYYDLEKAEEHFEAYIKKFEKHYKNDAERRMRFELFYNRLKAINQVNSNPNGEWPADLNVFSDRTKEEVKNLFGVKNRNTRKGVTYKTYQGDNYVDYHFSTGYPGEENEHLIFKTDLVIDQITKPKTIWIVDANDDSDRSSEKPQHLGGYKLIVETLNRPVKDFYKTKEHLKNNDSNKKTKYHTNSGAIGFVNNSLKMTTEDHPEPKNMWAAGLNNYSKESEGEVENKYGLKSPMKKLKGPIYDLDKTELYFKKFIEERGRHYASAKERKMRLVIFKKCLKKINEINSDPEVSWTADINDFSDWTDKELKQLTGFEMPVKTDKGPIYDLNLAENFFTNYLIKYNKQYTSPDEIEMRYHMFYKSLKLINTVNSDPTSTWAADLNEFSDRTEKELKEQFGFKMANTKLNGPIYNLDRAEDHFEDFIKTHRRHYPNLTEKSMRFNVFYNTLKTINMVNSDPKSTSIADINDYSDRTDDEVSVLIGYKKLLRVKNATIYDLARLAKNFNR